MDGLTNGRLPSARLLDHNGREIDPNREDRDDGLDLPHILTFGSLYHGAAYTYHHLFDEAIKHSRQNALAMRRDAWIMGLLSERADETLEKKWHLEPDNPKDPWQKTVADGVTKIIKGIHRLQEMRRYLLEGGLWYGRYGANVKWKWKECWLPVMEKKGPATPGMQSVPTMARGKVLTIVKHKPVNGDKIGHTNSDDAYVLIAGSFHDKIKGDPKIIYPNGAGAPALVLRGTWREQILMHRAQADDADYFDAEFGEQVHGKGIRNTIYWLDFLRRDYFGAVTEMLNRIGLGIVVIYYDQSNAAAKTEALDMAKKYSRRSVIVMPRASDSMSQGGAIEVVETPMAGATIMLELQTHVENQIERFMIGQLISGGGGSSNPLEGTGKSEFARDTKTKRCRSDAELFDDSLTGSDDEPGLVSIIKKWTYGFADFPLRWVTDHEENNPAEILDAVKVCVDMGVKFAEKDIREQTGLPAPEEGEPIIGGAKEALAQAQAEHIALLGQGGGKAQGGGIGLGGMEDEIPAEENEISTNPGVKPLQLSDEQPVSFYDDEQPFIPYHSDLTIKEVLKRIRILGPGAASAEYLKYLKHLLNGNPQLRRQMDGADLAFVQAMAAGSDWPTGDQQYSYDPTEPRDTSGKWTSGGNAHGDAEATIKQPSLVAKMKALPAATANKAKEFVTGLYSKAEKKYGPKWAKAIVATAIITLPTPVTMLSVAAMTGLAHVYTKYAGKSDTVAYAVDEEMADDDVNKAAEEFLHTILEGLQGEE